MKKPPQRRSYSGFTLIELMVAIAVSGIVLAGLVSVFTTANRSYTQQDEMATLQQNLRVAKMNLERDVRMAGCGFGSAFYNLGAQVFPLVNTDGGTAGSDSLTITYVDYDDPCNEALPQLTPSSISYSPSAMFTVSEDLSSTATPPLPPYSSWSTSVTCKVAGVPFGAVYIRPSTAGATNLISDVFTVESVDTPYTLNFSGLRTGITVPAPVPASHSIKFFSATQLVTVTYSFDSVSHTLTRNQQPTNITGAIADNIEDLQFAFGLDTDADDTVDSWINNADLDDTQKTQIRQVRISILGRSSRELPGQSANSRPLIEDHDAGTILEKYLRQLLQFEIKPRNLKG